MWGKNKKRGFVLPGFANPAAGGFTLIEVVTVLGISALLAMILLGFYQNTRIRTQFRDAVERTATELEKIKAEVNSSFTTGEGTSFSTVFFGKVVSFSEGAGTASIQTLVAERTENGSLSNPSLTTNTQEFPIPWGMTCTGDSCSTRIVITRNQTDGLLNTYLIPATEDLEDEDTYLANSTGTLSLDFISPEGLTAQITINALTNEVSRRYTN